MKYLVGFLILAGFFFYLGVTSSEGDARRIEKNAKRTVVMIQERAHLHLRFNGSPIVS